MFTYMCVCLIKFAYILPEVIKHGTSTNTHDRERECGATNISKGGGEKSIECLHIQEYTHELG